MNSLYYIKIKVLYKLNIKLYEIDKLTYFILKNLSNIISIYSIKI